MTEEAITAPASTPPSSATASYVAVVYFHGMGSQRRFEETSRLVDSIDRYLTTANGRKEHSAGFIAGIEPHIEPSHAEPDKTFTYIRSNFVGSPGNGQKPDRNVRYYEVYWAPIMAGHRSPWRVLAWLFALTFRPFSTLPSPWRERQRLRRAALVALFERSQTHSIAGIEKDDYSEMSALYDKFDGSDALADHAKGSFEEFLEFLKTKTDDAQVLSRRLKLAGLWRAAYRKREILNAFVLASLGLAMVLLGAGTVLATLVVLQRIGHIAAGTRLEVLAAAAPPTLQTALTVAAAVASIVGVTRFLSDYLGDVEAWATYDETDEKNELRQKIIERGMQTLTQVLGDPACSRVVVVAHSLGTSVAHDTLLNTARMNRSANAQDPIESPVPLRKIEHFVTMGSPIDKIEYFFESYRSASHRFRRVIETLRGDIGDVPFSRNRKPHIHWINFWDDGDPVSAPLRSPASASSLVQRVDNIHVASLVFPNPGASHLAYFDNRDVISSLSDVIHLRARSFCALPPRDRQDRDWESVYIGPAIDRPGRRHHWLVMAVALPWVTLAGIAAHAFIAAVPLLWSLAPAAIIVLLIAVGYVSGSRPVPGRSF